MANKIEIKCSNSSHDAGFLISKEAPNDVNNFTKSFSQILSFNFYCFHYVFKISLGKYSINTVAHFTNNLHRRVF